MTVIGSICRVLGRVGALSVTVMAIFCVSNIAFAQGSSRCSEQYRELDGCKQFCEQCASASGVLGTALQAQDIGLIVARFESQFLGCNTLLVGQGVELANCLKTNTCMPETLADAAAKAAGLACELGKCAAKSGETGSTVYAALCTGGQLVATGIKCFGFYPALPVGGWAGLCDTSIKNRKPAMPGECPLSPQAPACNGTNGGPKTDGDILKWCQKTIADYKLDPKSGVNSGNFGGCLSKCENLSRAADSNCKTNCSNKGGNGNASYSGSGGLAGTCK